MTYQVITGAVSHRRIQPGEKFPYAGRTMIVVSHNVSHDEITLTLRDTYFAGLRGFVGRLITRLKGGHR